MIEHKSNLTSSNPFNENHIQSNPISDGDNLKLDENSTISKDKVSQQNPSNKFSCTSNRNSFVSSFCKIAGVLALVISVMHMYCDYHDVDKLALMISGFNMVTYHDSSGNVLPERTIYIDLAFINKGNQHQNILDGRFVFPESSDFPNVYWSMFLDIAHLEPFAIPPGETVV